jgi:hypothetical protein
MRHYDWGREELCHDRLVAHRGQTLHFGLFFLCSEPLFYPLTGVLRECVGVGPGELTGMLARRIVQETDLLSISATPLTKQEMDPQAKSLHQGEFALECLRLKAAGLLASGRQQGNRFGKRFHQIRLSSPDTLSVIF